MIIHGIRSVIRAIEKNSSLFEEKNFDQRADAIDFLEFQMIGLRPGDLKDRAEKLKTRLEETDRQLFEKLRESIRAGKYKGSDFRNMVSEYAGINTNDEPGYNNPDIFINGIFHFQPMPEQTKALEPEMVFYQKTPARVIFELAEKVHFTEHDVFFDIGSGLGQAVILVNLLTGVKTIGTEFEPAFCEYARACAAELNLTDVTFVNTDARNADYSGGTIFFMYTPFTGDMLNKVLVLLKKEALHREIKIITYGPCTLQVAEQSWLRRIGPKDTGIYKPVIFYSF